MIGFVRSSSTNSSYMCSRSLVANTNNSCDGSWHGAWHWGYPPWVGVRIYMDEPLHSKVCQGTKQLYEISQDRFNLRAALSRGGLSVPCDPCRWGRPCRGWIIGLQPRKRQHIVLLFVGLLTSVGALEQVVMGGHSVESKVPALWDSAHPWSRQVLWGFGASMILVLIDQLLNHRSS